MTKNRRDRRRRHLFQGRFKSLLLEDEHYGSRVSRYTHLNPAMIKSALSKPLSERAKLIRDYRWSSSGMLIGLRRCPKWLDRESVLCRWGENLKGQRVNYGKYVEEGLLGDIEDPFEVAAARSIFGSDNFIDKYRRSLKFLDEKVNSLREQGQARKLQFWVNLDTLVDSLSKSYQVSSEELLRPNYRDTDGRQFLIYLSSKLCRGRNSLTLLSEKLGISVGGMSAARYKMTNRLKKDSRLRKKLNEIEISIVT